MYYFNIFISKLMYESDKWRFPHFNKNQCHTYLYGKSIYKIYLYSVILKFIFRSEVAVIF
jgi:hypothetical protein